MLAEYPGLSGNSALIKKLQDLKLVVFDVDGVLTDGKLIYTDQGELTKQFDVKDGVALKLLPKWGIHVAVITAKDSPGLRKRMSDLDVNHVYFGCHDKLAAFDDLTRILSLPPLHVAYVGDDVIDLQVIPKVGISLCPRNAHILLLRHCDIKLKQKAGQGVAREVADLVLSSRMTLEHAYEFAVQTEFEEIGQ